MKVLRLPSGRRVNLDQLALWRVDGGQITAMLSGHGQLVEIVGGIAPQWAEGIGLLMDEAAISSSANVLLDLGEVLLNFEAGAYVSEDLPRGRKPQGLRDR